MSERAERRARETLVGVSVGDALGETFFGPAEAVIGRIERRELPPPVWRWTDDTQMAAALVASLRRHDGEIDADDLMRAFADAFEIHRGYGGTMREVLLAVRSGAPWRPLVRGAFDGLGSWGNGAAMRVAPVGAWYADDPARAADHARAQAVVTHAHREAAEGAAAVAVAASLLVDRSTPLPSRPTLLAEVASFVEPSRVRLGLLEAADLDLTAGTVETSQEAARVLGNGRDVSAQDTVPFALWCALSHPDDLVQTFWTTVGGLGDRDTTCAMACGVVAARVGLAGIPPEWVAATEPLPASEEPGRRWFRH
jgi:ADP-ribosylglycohydrolase